MLEHFKGDEEFVKKIIDYKTQALFNQRLILTKFLNPYERDLVRQVVGHSLSLHEYGGFEGAENQRMILCPSFYDINRDDFKITTFQIDYNEQFGQIKHRDIFGALMHLGLKRDCIGDIVDTIPAFACARENAEYIQMHLERIKRSSITLREVNDPLEVIRTYQTKQCVVSSMRLDKIIASVYGLSRSKAAVLIRQGQVKVNYKENLRVDHLCHDGDMLSLAHHGRASIVLTPRKTKQGNLVLEVNMYK